MLKRAHRSDAFYSEYTITTMSIFLVRINNPITVDAM